jgi:hypothetical protein
MGAPKLSSATAAKLVALDHRARDQYGMVSRRQLLAAGWTSSEIAHRVRSGRWQTVHPGVYAAFTGELCFEARVWAALLLTGPDAVASHTTAARLQGLTDHDPEVIDLTVPHDSRITSTSSLRVHRSRSVEERRRLGSSIAQTRVEDTTLDLVDGCVRADDVVGWLTRACQRRLTTPPRLLAAAHLRARCRWRALSVQVLAEVADGVASPLELAYRSKVARPHGLPTGEAGARTSVRGTGQFADVLYRRFRLRIELEGLAWHPEDARWRDARRDKVAVLDGDVVLRYDWRAVVGRPCETAAEVAAALAARGWTGRARPCSPGCAIRATA